MSARAGAGPRVAVIVPIYRHSVLLVEAIASALDQRAPFAVSVVLVNDGCSYAETDAVCREAALSEPQRVRYLRKPNGGLSSARNFGVAHVLAQMPQVEAIYMLDADNRLRPDALARAMAALDGEPDIDWIYPNIDMFGLSWSGDYGGDYSLLINTSTNICEAGSLIRRRVFERVLFDTDFRLGWEDWDFFLSAAQAGFKGRNLEDFGFLYRKRPESMLADAERDQRAIAGSMWLKHKRLLEPRNLLVLEQTEAPRYAIYMPDRNEVLLCSDPEAPGTRRRKLDEFEADHWLSMVSPGRVPRPLVMVVMASEVFDVLSRLGLLHWTLWKFETILLSHPIAVLAARTHDSDRLAVAELADGTTLRRDACAVAMTGKLFSEVMQDQNSQWIDSLVGPRCEPPLYGLDLQLPICSQDAAAINKPFALFDLLSFIHRLRASPLREAATHSWDWREVGITERREPQSIVRKALDGAPVYPRMSDGRRHVALLMPMLEFGGVEKVALNIARGLRAHGLVPHVVVLESTDAAISEEWRRVVESISFLSDPAFKTWGGSQGEYLGTPVPEWAAGMNHGPALGLLHWVDVAISFHGGAIAGVMGRLRRLGVQTVLSLHLNDLTALGRPRGNTYLGLAYEHAFDLFAPCSHALGDWLHAMGVPADKICIAQNAPGFDVAADALARGQAARLSRADDQPLRVLYLGRLDRQKGIERLGQVIRGTAARGLYIDWRIIGKSVFAEDAPALGPEITELLEPPLTRSEDLAEAYAWADVLVLLSSYEGLPLTVLEAMRSGAVVIATDVGATAEVLHDGRNGVLVPLQTAVRDCIAELTLLSADRARLRRLSETAFADRKDYDWVEATRELATRLTPPPAD